MSLRQQAAADLLGIVEDGSGFSWPLTVTSPTGITLDLGGLSTDIGASIDPATGMMIAGRLASVALPTKRFVDAGLELPCGIADANRKPWRVTFADIHGRAATFKVSVAMPDVAVGLVTCMLEAYKP